MPGQAGCGKFPGAQVGEVEKQVAGGAALQAHIKPVQKGEQVVYVCAVRAKRVFRQAPFNGKVFKIPIRDGMRELLCRSFANAVHPIITWD